MATILSELQAVTPAFVERRAEPRYRVLVASVAVQQRRGPAIEAVLHDLSIHGCRLACRTLHAEGMRLRLRFREGDGVGATVMWNNGEFIGCRFDTPLDEAIVESLTKAPN